MSSYKNLESLVEKYIHKLEELSLVIESVQQGRDEYNDLYFSSQEKLEAAERESDELRAEQAEHDEQIARMESKFSLAKRALDSKTARCEKAEAELRRRDAAAGEPEFYVRYRSDGGYEGPLHKDATEECRKQSWSPLYAAAAPAVLASEVEELSMLIRRLVHTLKNSNPHNGLLWSVPDFMHRKGYWKESDCLRGGND